jgi:hypothetical protein
MKRLFIAIIVFASLGAQAQELECQVSVSSSQVQMTERRVFETLRTAIYEFMNNRQWTELKYTLDERIECSIMINVTQAVSSDRYRATIQVQSRRPIYNTSYNTVLLNILDKDLEFEYVENTPLEWTDGTFNSNLTGVLAYYAYLIIGFDFDSFQQNAGSPYFEKAQSIAAMGQSNRYQDGWMAFGTDRNRYWLTENLLNSRYSALREANYKYHRLGLDQMYEKKEKSRELILESLEALKKVNADRPNLYLKYVFMLAKSDELIKLFSDPSVSPMEKARAVNLLSEIDPSNANKYQAILQAK